MNYPTCFLIYVHAIGSGFHAGSVWDASTRSTVGTVPTARMDCRAQSRGNAYAGDANVFVLFARLAAGYSLVFV